MIKILLGGSPCTHWSIAQKNNRETEPEGLGWELFKNYLIAKEKFKPDFFLYENNKSAAQAIKDQISKELEVNLMYINSALVSAQNRQRFYAFNWDVEQPEDRGIVLRDILESGENLSSNEKSYALTTRCSGAIPEDTIRRRHTMVVEPVCVAQRGRYADTGNRAVKGNGPIEQFYEAREDGKTNTLTTVQKDNYVAEPVAINTTDVAEAVCMRYERSEKAKKVRKQYEAGQIHHGFHELSELHPRTDGKTNTLSTVLKDNPICVPIKVGGLPRPNGEISTSQGKRIYSVDGKSVCLSSAQSGGNGDAAAPATGLYAVPSIPDGVKVYEVKNGLITIKEKQYPIKLADGFYIIRKLTPIECERLQTLPDNYTAAVSNTQRYKGLGNGWTAEVIIHVLNGALKDVPKDEEIVVLSMYDGIGTGRYCLDKMGFTNVKYFAYEIDKYAKQVAMSNYPDIIQMGDAFDLRHPDWTIGY